MSYRTSDLCAVIDELAEELKLAQTKLDRLRAIARQPTGDQPFERDPKDLISPGYAATLANRSKSTINRWANDNPLDQSGGFAIRTNKRWQISKSRFLHFLAGMDDPSAVDGTFER